MILPRGEAILVSRSTAPQDLRPTLLGLKPWVATMVHIFVHQITTRPQVRQCTVLKWWICRVEPNPCQPFSQIDQFALVSFYNELTVQPNWNLTISLCGQQGVTCSNGHVVELSLASIPLVGTIASELGILSQLTYL